MFILYYAIIRVSMSLHTHIKQVKRIEYVIATVAC